MTHVEQKPIDMLLFCPKCSAQHIDAPEEAPRHYNCSGESESILEATWRNPPHRSHLCHGCGHIWRPADVPTNGVAEIKTRGEKDGSAVPKPGYPETMTPELREVLGMLCFQCAPIAHAFKAAGYDIPPKAEEEQAFVIHWLTRIVLQHGRNWREVAGNELRTIKTSLAQKAAHERELGRVA